MRVGLIDFDGKQVNLALMKLSAWHKAQGDTVVLNEFTPADVDHVYVSVLFDKNRDAAAQLANRFPSISFGGTGWDLTTVLAPQIEAMRPDYDLYRANDIYQRLKGISTRASRMEKAETICNAGIGFISRGCTRACAFCKVPRKEGNLRRVANLADLINPRSNVVTLLDNNLTANPDILHILAEVRERNLVIDITQGVDVRTMTPEIARALASVKHLRSVHYAWDQINFEGKVLAGIETLAQHVARWRHLCFTLTGFDTNFKEDYHRFKILTSRGIDPYVMIYDKRPLPRKFDEKRKLPFEELRRHHFSRWVNGRIYTKCPDFDRYTNWLRDKKLFAPASFGQQQSLDFNPYLPFMVLP